MNRFLVSLAFAPLVVACQDSTVDIGQLDNVLDLRALPNRDVDVLFVIDNSPSMADKQAALVAGFPKMMDALGTLEGGLPNLHIGVITSDMGSMGSLDLEPGPTIGNPQYGGCSGRGDDGNLKHNDGPDPAVELGGALYISDLGNEDGSRTRNYTGELRDVFTKIATVGAGGCGFEQHLASMRRALTNTANGDFLRPNANLAVVILADEDDCSMAHSALLGPESDMMGLLGSFRCTRFGIECDVGGETTDAMNQLGVKDNCHPRTDSAYVEDVTPFVDFLNGLKDDPRAVMVAAIAGPTTPVTIELRTSPVGAGIALAHSCTYLGSGNEPELADPAVRIHALVDAFEDRSSFSTVCTDDLSLSLASIGYSTRQLVGDPCITAALADTSTRPGLQPRCDVLDGTEATPACDGTNNDHCWQMITDAVSCSATPDHLRFEVLRSTVPDANSYVSVRCLRAP